MKRKLALLLISLLPILLLSGCTFDIVQLTQNPIFMVVAGILIVIYMMKKSK